MNDLTAIKRLLLIIVIPLIVYLLKLLSFIFIPLVLALFIALVFMPLMRWMSNRKIPQWVSVLVVLFILFWGIKVGVELVKLSGKEIVDTDERLWDKVIHKANTILIPMQEFFGLENPEGENGVQYLLKTDEVGQAIYQNFGSTFKFVRKTVSMLLMTLFFMVLVLAGSLNIERIMNATIFHKRFTSVKTFLKIERSIVQFLKVKFFVSLATGVAFGLTAWIFGVRFVIFWGLLAFALNFIQLLGSVVVTALMALFAFTLMGPTGSLLLLILILIAIQILLGSVLEPIWMGETFKINTVTVLVMLMLWGFIWGIPGLILSVPITVFVKSILEQFPKTKVIADIMS